MNAFADILEAIAHAPIEKRAITNHGVLNEPTPTPSQVRSRAACGSILAESSSC